MTTVGGDVVTESATLNPVERVAAALRSHNIEAIVVDTGQEARQVVPGLILEGAEVHSGKSKMLEDVGLYSELVEIGTLRRHSAADLRDGPRDAGREIRKLVTAPDFILGSVAAVTDDGTLVAASATGGQLGAYAAGAGRVILTSRERALRTLTISTRAGPISSSSAAATAIGSDRR